MSNAWRAGLDLDYCPVCDLPTFNHEEVALVRGQYLHKHCLEGSVMVVKRDNLIRPPSEPTE